MNAFCKSVPCLLLAAGFMLPAPAWAHDAHAEPAARPSAAPPTRPASWSQAPLIAPVGGRPEPGAALMAASGIATAELTVLSPDQPGQPRSVQAEGGRWRVTPDAPGKGGYYLLQLRSTADAEVRTAMTAWNFQGKAAAPTRTLAAIRPGLEILPQVLPEHGGMREGEAHRFAVRFDGRPLPGAVVQLETQPGSRSRVVAGPDGVATVVFPRDFDPAQFDPKAGMGRARQAFVLSVSHQAGAMRHESAFNFFYYPDLMRERDQMAGYAVLVAGMLLATPLLRHRKEQS